MDFKVTTDCGTQRIARAAFEYARKNGKTNGGHRHQGQHNEKDRRQVLQDLPRSRRRLSGDHRRGLYIDIMTANLIKEGRRNQFQVFVLPNLYGDIITDEAAEIQGGVGTAGSANIGDHYAMFEAIHGSAPRMMEEGRGEYANPSSLIKASELLLRHIGMIEAADRLAAAMRPATGKGRCHHQPQGRRHLQRVR